MQPPLPFPAAVARLLPAAHGPARRYLPLVAGTATLVRRAGSDRWTVAIACDRRLLPRAPRRGMVLAHRSRDPGPDGGARRVGIAVVGPLDVVGSAGERSGRHRGPLSSPRLRLDFYGWALMYQPPGMRGRAVVDGDRRFADLPAVFELPLELIDRAEFLEARGFRTRPLLIPTLPADFVAGPDGRLRNRFFPSAACRHPSQLDGLL